MSRNRATQISESRNKKKSRESAQWFKSKLTKLSQLKKSERVPPYIGGMFCYSYDAKHKETLPYWDKFPLMIVLDIYSDGFLGLNLHYLPPRAREILLRELIKRFEAVNGAIDGKANDGKKRNARQQKKLSKQEQQRYLKISYPLLFSLSGSKEDWAKACIKRYLASHIRSEMVNIHFDEWEAAIDLPLQDFQKASARQVWSDSTR